MSKEAQARKERCPDPTRHVGLLGGLPAISGSVTLAIISNRTYFDSGYEDLVGLEACLIWTGVSMIRHATTYKARY